MVVECPFHFGMKSKEIIDGKIGGCLQKLKVGKSDEFLDFTEHSRLKIRA